MEKRERSMIKPKYHWDTKSTTTTISDETADQFKLTPIVKKVLESKGITEQQDIAQILEQPTPEHDVNLLSDIDKAVERINHAIDQNEMILVYGDYDADGVTSTTILVTTLRELGAHVGWYIPNRFSEGYGPNELAFRNAHDEGVSLIITVDNGIQGHQPIEVAQSLGVDVIVTDHHEIGDTLPDAYAIVHPMHPEYDYPFKYLCGAGVAYKLSQALLSEPPEKFKALAAIGTIADLVSLTDENRTIVKEGLEVLNTHCPESIKAILAQASYKDDITEETIGFVIGPRLNAVGRLEDAAMAAELLMADTEDEATFLAEQVEFFNQERKNIVSQIVDEAMEMAESQVEQGNQFLLLAKEDWHEGVLGIVASRIVETYSLPTILLNIDTEQQHAKGSARSIEQVSMFDILNEHAELISKFGGHHMAAGMTLAIDQVEPLRKALNESMERITASTSLVPTKKVDVKLSEADISIKNIQDIYRLRPFGTDFSSPCFELQEVPMVQAKAIGQEGKHLKLTLGDSHLQALYWNNGNLIRELETQQPIDIIGTLQINEWNGHQSPQFIIDDLGTNQLQILDYRSKNKWNQFDQHMSDVAFLIHPKSEKLADNYYYYGEEIEQHYDKYVFRDLPSKLEDVETTLQHVDLSQIYLELKHDQSIYFEGMPKIDTFKNCYKALLKKGEIHLAEDGMPLCQFLNVKPNILMFMLKVFLELGFIQNEADRIVVSQQTEKKSIESSQLYQARLQRIEVEQLLLYEDFAKLKAWIKSELTVN